MAPSMPDHVVVRTEDLVAVRPRLFHMTSAGAWPAIERHGLRSVTAVLDLLYFDPEERQAIEALRRPQTIVLADPRLGKFEIRDQKPLNLGKLEACLVDMTPKEWAVLVWAATRQSVPMHMQGGSSARSSRVQPARRRPG